MMDRGARVDFREVSSAKNDRHKGSAGDLLVMNRGEESPKRHDAR
jgi:hypothetical protein